MAVTSDTSSASTTVGAHIVQCLAELRMLAKLPRVGTVKVKGTMLGTFTPVNTSTTKFSSAAKQEKGKPIPAEYENEKGEKVKVATETKGEGTEAFGYEGSGLASTQTVVITGEPIEVSA